MHPVWMAGQLVIIQLRGHTSATSRLQSGRARPPSGLLCSAAEGFPVAARSTSLLLSSQPPPPFLLCLAPWIVSLPLHKVTHTCIHLHSPSLSLLHFTFLLFATSTPPTATLIRESSSRESEELWYIGRTHCTGWNAICPPRKAITIRSRENCPISNDTNGRISGNLYLVASPFLPSPLPSAHLRSLRRTGVRVVEIGLALETSRHTVQSGRGYKRAGNSPRRVGRSLARTRGGGAESARLRCAALYTIGYEVVVTWLTDDVTHSVTRPRSTIPEISRHRLVHLASRIFWDEDYGKKMIGW